MYQVREVDKTQDKRNRQIRKLLEQGKSALEIIAIVNAIDESPIIQISKPSLVKPIKIKSIKPVFDWDKFKGKNQM